MAGDPKNDTQENIREEIPTARQEGIWPLKKHKDVIPIKNTPNPNHGIACYCTSIKTE